MRFQVKCVILFLALLTISLNEVQAQRRNLFHWIDVQPSGISISHDGSTVIGSKNNRAFRWTKESGRQDLGRLGSGPTIPQFVSRDGRVVVGQSSGRAFRWTQAGGIQDLGTLGGAVTNINAMSSDGSTVVGTSGGRAFRWTQAGGMQDLGPGTASGVSADGRIVVGLSGERAFRWTPDTGTVDLSVGSNLPNRFSFEQNISISDDGNIIAGVVKVPKNLSRPRSILRDRAFYRTNDGTFFITMVGVTRTNPVTFQQLLPSGKGMLLHSHAGGEGGYGGCLTIPTFHWTPMAWRGLVVDSASADGSTLATDGFRGYRGGIWRRTASRGWDRRSLQGRFAWVPHLRNFGFAYGQNTFSWDGRYAVVSAYHERKGRWMGAWIDTVGVPEPASLFVLGSGLLWMAFSRRRRVRDQSDVG